MNLNLRENIGIKDAITYNVIKATSDVAISEIAEMMTQNNISSVVIEDEKVKGIVTTNNIISKVVSKNISPKDITADMVMEDYVSISPNTSLAEASTTMIKNKCKVVLVIEDEQLKGLLTLTDIVRVSPELIELFMEGQDIDDKYYEHRNYDDDEAIDEGVCENCGAYDTLRKYDGQYVCSECIDEELDE